MKTSALQSLSSQLLAMMERGVSVIVSSRDAANRPSIMRAVGSAVAPDAAAVTVYLSRRQSGQLLRDVAATGAVAAVFCEPYSHCAIQFKASRATLRDADASDAPLLASYLASMELEIARVGFTAELARAMLAHRLEDVVAIRFAPEQAFDQTPGPQAGTALADQI